MPTADYSAMRELMATVPRLGPAAPGVLLAVACLVVVFVRWRSRPQQRPLLALLAGAGVAAIATLLVLRMHYAGAPTIGWPLVWSVPMLPYRMLGLPLDPDVAFGFGLALSLAANAVTVVSTYLLGLWTSGSRSTGLVAASLFGLWPFLLPVVGKTADLGTWQGDLGLSLYSEPLSTALVTTGAALLVRPGRGHVAEVVAGCLLGFSIAVRLSNLVIAVPLVALLALQSGPRPALRFGAAVAIFVPIAVAYWPAWLRPAAGRAVSGRPVCAALRGSGLAGTRSCGAGRPSLRSCPSRPSDFSRCARPQAVLLASWILATAGLTRSTPSRPSIRGSSSSRSRRCSCSGAPERRLSSSGPARRSVAEEQQRSERALRRNRESGFTAPSCARRRLPGVKAPKILAVASAVDLDFRYGCTPAWWQLWKGMYEVGVDLIVTPYRGRPVESPWWRTAANPTTGRGRELRRGSRRARAAQGRPLSASRGGEPGRVRVRQGRTRGDLALGHALAGAAT